jgi:hypothetical protein
LVVTASLCFSTAARAAEGSRVIAAHLAAGDPWPMHHVSDDYQVANSAGLADVNQDGYLDLAVIDEGIGSLTILFHPGKGADPRRPWQRVVLGVTGNPEYACLGDLDGDGHYDYVAVEGDDLEKGLRTGVRIIWGPRPSETALPEKWEAAGHIPGTEGQQYLYAECRDINGDGATDIVVGGRRHSVTKQYAGIRWLEAPRHYADRRNLKKWRQHFIAPNAFSGHAFVFADADQDGDEDLLDANADWDTSEWDEEILWFENPGTGRPAQRKPWKQRQVWRSAAFYPKPQIGVGDVDGDGLLDLVTQTQNSIHVLRKIEKTAASPAAWHRTEIQKPEAMQWIGRPCKFADLNGDGRLDIVAALIHNDGNLPADKFSVFWLEQGGPKEAPTWTARPIKASDGYNSRQQWIGEKWDHLLPLDVDGDGDLDLLGNVEEHYRWVKERKRIESFFSVVWFENRLK